MMPFSWLSNLIDSFQNYLKLISRKYRRFAEMTRIVKIDENIEGTVRVSSHYWLQVFCGVNAAPFPKQSKKE